MSSLWYENVCVWECACVCITECVCQDVFVPVLVRQLHSCRCFFSCSGELSSIFQVHICKWLQGQCGPHCSVSKWRTGKGGMWEEEPSLSLWVAEWVGKRELQGLEPLLSPWTHVFCGHSHAEINASLKYNSTESTPVGLTVITHYTPYCPFGHYICVFWQWSDE